MNQKYPGPKSQKNKNDNLKWIDDEHKKAGDIRLSRRSSPDKVRLSPKFGSDHQPWFI